MNFCQTEIIAVSNLHSIPHVLIPDKSCMHTALG
jgi:hypothetical protein